jgi:hypothetical protein
MSGGYFNYDQYKLGYIADSIEQLVRDNNSTELNDWGNPKGHNFTPETIAEFEQAIRFLKQAVIYAQRIDWLVSGDDGEDTFHVRLKEDLDNEQLTD